MFLHRIVPALAVVLVFAAQDAQAFFDPPWITPAAPRAGEPVSLNVSGGICDVFVERPGYPQVSRNADEVRIVEYGNRETFDDFCIYGVWSVTQPIGAFPPGAYTLTIDFTHENCPFGYETVTVGVIPFSVAGAMIAAAPVPAVSLLGKFVLLALVCVITARAGQMRQRNSHVYR